MSEAVENCTSNCATCGKDCASRTSPQSFLKAHHPDARVRRVYGVVSGKGGVGKSMVTSQLAVLLRRRDDAREQSIPSLSRRFRRSACPRRPAR